MSLSAKGGGMGGGGVELYAEERGECVCVCVDGAGGGYLRSISCIKCKIFLLQIS